MKAVIAAAWYWTRMLPITKSIPKELMPVWNKPVIQYIVEWLVQTGVKDIVIITSQWKQALEDYFDKNYELEEVLKKKGKLELLEEVNKPKNLANYSFVKQKQQLWFAHAVLETKPWVEKDYFILTVWDTIFHPGIYSDMIELHRKTWFPVVWLQEVPMDDVSKYWVVKIEEWKITDMVEKPKKEEAPSNLIMIWVYVLPRSIFDVIEQTPMDQKSWEILLPDALKILMSTVPILPYVTKHKIWDVWTPELWLKANNEIFQNWIN